jgi:hypothetical protein
VNGEGSLSTLSAKIRGPIGIGKKASGIAAVVRFREKIVDWELVNSAIASERKEME